MHKKPDWLTQPRGYLAVARGISAAPRSSHMFPDVHRSPHRTWSEILPVQSKNRMFPDVPRYWLTETPDGPRWSQIVSGTVGGSQTWPGWDPSCVYSWRAVSDAPFRAGDLHRVLIPSGTHFLRDCHKIDECPMTVVISEVGTFRFEITEF